MNCRAQANFARMALFWVVTLLVSVNGAIASTPTYYLYGITSAGKLWMINTGSCTVATSRSAIGSYTGFTALLYVKPYFYGVYGGGKLVRFGLSPGDETYIGDTGYPYIRAISQASDGNTYVTLSQTSGGNASYVGQISLSNAQVTGVTNVPMDPNYQIVPNYLGLTSNPGGGLQAYAYDPVHGGGAFGNISLSTYTFTVIPAGFLQGPIPGDFVRDPNNSNTYYYLYNCYGVDCLKRYDQNGDTLLGSLIDEAGNYLYMYGITFGPPVYDDGLEQYMAVINARVPTPTATPH
jgi:hypothetical protein